MTNPNFFIVGPPKCASSSLYFYLNQHPDITLSPTKETHFFSLRYAEGIDSYLNNYFKNLNGKIIGEADPTYSFLFYPLQHIKNNFPDAKLVYCLRNPVDRAFSGWCMRTEKGAETLPFKEALLHNAKSREKFTFFDQDAEKIWIKEQAQIDKINKLSIPTYIDAGLYGEMLEYAFKLFPREQIKIVEFSDLINNQSTVLKSIYDFLGVDSEFTIKKNEVINQYKSNKMRYLYNLLGRKRTREIGEYIPKGLKNFIKLFFHQKKEKPVLSAEDRKFAYPFFKDDIEKLEKLLGQSFQNWKVS